MSSTDNYIDETNTTAAEKIHKNVSNGRQKAEGRRQKAEGISDSEIKQNKKNIFVKRRSAR